MTASTRTALRLTALNLALIAAMAIVALGGLIAAMAIVALGGLTP